MARYAPHVVYQFLKCVRHLGGNSPCSRIVAISRIHHAVAIEPGLRRAPPENGNISTCGGRLSVNSPRNSLDWEPGDRPPNRKSPPMVGISPTMRHGFSDHRT